MANAEILVGPLSLYWAATGSAFPLPTVTPPGPSSSPVGPWNLIGTSGASNYSEDGVVIASNQEVDVFRSLGESGPLKTFLTAEDLVIRVTVHDMTLEMVRLAFGNNTVTTSSPPGTKTLGLYRGPGEITQMALLVRGTNKSPYLSTVNMQFEVPLVQHMGSFDISFLKGTPPAGVMLEFNAIVDTTASSADQKFGRLIAATS